ncbi:hippurate hydrolase [Faunimonas pinastri]|uniref:Hippurate hydrolase n=1 Tax=Faunimonas pinastri TaxID=1855383 RepID=A0A1H9NLA4_9HYPH|nr:M20 aminoacylase family protein [Faunimonas pinastri]SER36720.1 hippurate hydrolase [Faunimonas pinastri]
MPVINRFAELHREITEWRREFHRRPELLYDVQGTAAEVAAKLREFGCDEVVEGVGRTGVVAAIRGDRTNSDRVIGLRADMDALPITEMTNKPWASTVPGKMHACGHDGHTAMLLGAAKYLAETRRFGGTAVLIFQPAEEGGAGARTMMQDGLIERFGIQEVYAMHNWPGLPVGHFATRSGAIMASADQFTIEIAGRGGHAAKPHETVDPVVVATHIVQALQTIVARNLDPLKSAVISVTTIHAGEAFNVIPPKVTMTGTARALDPLVRDLVERRMHEMVPGLAEAFGATGTLNYRRGDPVTVNHPEQTEMAIAVASEIAGRDNVLETPPSMAGEDFAYMLEARPGAMVFIGNGDSAGLHHPEYDFTDAAIPFGSSFWVRMIETLMPAAQGIADGGAARPAAGWR